MGFKLPPRLAVLTFEELEGFEECQVRLSLSITWDDYFEFDEADAKMDREAMRAMLDKFGDQWLYDWNMTRDDDTPIPATGEGLRSIDSWFGLMLIEKWKEAMQAAAGTSGRPLASTLETEPERSEGSANGSEPSPVSSSAKTSSNSSSSNGSHAKTKGRQRAKNPSTRT